MIHNKFFILLNYYDSSGINGNSIPSSFDVSSVLLSGLLSGLLSDSSSILLTHDHQFVQTVADRIIEISGNRVIDRMGTYDEFLENVNEEQLKKY